MTTTKSAAAPRTVQITVEQNGKSYTQTVLQDFTRFAARQTPLYLAFALFFFAELWTAATQLFTVRVTTPLIHKKEPLPDLVHEYLPYIKIKGISDTFCGIVLVASLVRVFLSGPRLMVILRRILLIAAICYFVRGLSISLTVLPSPDVLCINYIHDNYVISAFLILLGANVTCGDVFFSGHTIATTMCICFWWTYTSNLFLKIVITFLGFVAYMVITMSHFHYTIDVVYGFLIAFAVWTYYHYMVRRRKLSVAESPVWSWFERDAHLEQDERSTITFLFGPKPIKALLDKVRSRSLLYDPINDQPESPHYEPTAQIEIEIKDQPIPAAAADQSEATGYVAVSVPAPQTTKPV